LKCVPLRVAELFSDGGVGVRGISERAAAEEREVGVGLIEKNHRPVKG
jgi:hypothetical protein